MIFKKTFALLTLLVLFTVNSPLLTVYAQSDAEMERQLQEKQQKIRELQSQIDQTHKQEKTLTSQLKVIDTQTALTELKIDKTLFEITKLEKEITDLGGRITRISGTLDNLTELLLNRIVSTYKYSNANFLDLIFSSHGFNDVLERIKYLQVVQAYDKKDLEKYQTDLTEQKKAKEDLLRVTQNDEKKFQAELSRLKADAESISRALANKGAKVGPVKKGERIAGVGNSGCSTGPHLHLEVMTPARVEDGIIIGKENKVNPKPYIDSGQISKPTANYSGSDCSNGGSCLIGDITTHFGQRYFLGTHTGLDIAGNYGESIYAAQDGDAYQTKDNNSCYLTGTVGKGIYIDHHNGIVTLYWHIP